MKEYRILYDESAEMLSKAVTELLQDGWSLYGPPFPTWRQNQEEDWIYQAMVR